LLPARTEVRLAALTTNRSSLSWLQGRASILLQRLNQTWRRPEKEGGAVRKEQVFQVMLATLWPGSVRSALFILFFNQSD